jgi:hypothetical protein
MPSDMLGGGIYRLARKERLDQCRPIPRRTKIQYRSSSLHDRVGGFHGWAAFQFRSATNVGARSCGRIRSASPGHGLAWILPSVLLISFAIQTQGGRQVGCEEGIGPPQQDLQPSYDTPGPRRRRLVQLSLVRCPHDEQGWRPLTGFCRFLEESLG